MQQPFARGGPELLFAVADEHYEAFVRDHAHLLRSGGPPVRILRTSELRDPSTDADLVFGRYRPTKPDCRCCFSRPPARSSSKTQRGWCTATERRCGRHLRWRSAIRARPRRDRCGRSTRRPCCLLGPICAAQTCYFCARRVRCSISPDCLAPCQASSTPLGWQPLIAC